MKKLFYVMTAMMLVFAMLFNVVAFAAEDSEVLAAEDSEVLAAEDSEVLAAEDSEVLATEDSEVLATEDSEVLATEDSEVLATEEDYSLASELKSLVNETADNEFDGKGLIDSYGLLANNADSTEFFFEEEENISYKQGIEGEFSKYSGEAEEELLKEQSALFDEFSSKEGTGTLDEEYADLDATVYYYSKFPGVPDFGKTLGYSLYTSNVSGDSGVYYYRPYDSSWASSYMSLLEYCGFSYIGSTDLDSGGLMLVYTKSGYNVGFGVDYLGSTEVVFVMAQKTTSKIYYYSKFSSVPDFGKTLGFSVYDSYVESDGGIYYYRPTGDTWASDYGDLLESCGFKYVGATELDSGGLMLVYTKSGYTVGFGTDYLGSVPVVFVLISKSGSSTKSYTISYNANGGSGAPSSQTKTHGTSITLSTVIPSRTGYYFKGWATSSSGKVVYDPGDTYSANSSVTLYAVWEPYKYSVVYYSNGGQNAPESQEKLYNKDLKLSTKKPTRNGYKFLGWSTNKNATTPEYKAGATYKGNTSIALYAVWEEVIVQVSKVSLNASSLSLVVGDEAYLVATVAPSNAKYKYVNWSSSDRNIATVDDYGVVTAHRSGSVKITATSHNGKSATCKVTVGAPADIVEFKSLKSTSLAVGKTLTLSAKASCSNGTKPVSTNVVYEIISGSRYATIDAKGKLKGIATGKVVVRATAEAGTAYAYADIVINVCIPATKVTLNTKKASVMLGGELWLDATIAPVNSTDTLTWSSSDESIATVDEYGVVKTYRAGSVKITAKSGSGKSATCTVTVGAPADAVEIKLPKSGYVAVGKSITLSAKAYCKNGAKPISTGVVYEIVSGEEYATIDAKGKLKGIATGTVRVRVRAEVGVASAYDEILLNICIPATKVTLNTTKATISVGEELWLDATVAPINNTDNIIWFVDKENVATIDQNGIVTALAKGKVKVTAMATASGKKATCTITVVD